jgi:hypothetical protein
MYFDYFHPSILFIFSQPLSSPAFFNSFWWDLLFYFHRYIITPIMFTTHYPFLSPSSHQLVPPKVVPYYSHVFYYYYWARSIFEWKHEILVFLNLAYSCLTSPTPHCPFIRIAETTKHRWPRTRMNEERGLVS